MKALSGQKKVLVHFMCQTTKQMYRLIICQKRENDDKSNNNFTLDYMEDICQQVTQQEHKSNAMRQSLRPN